MCKFLLTIEIQVAHGLEEACYDCRVVLSVFAVLMLAGTSVDICRRSGLTFRSFLTVSLVHDARLAENDVDMLLLTAAPSVEVAEPGEITVLCSTA